MAKTLTCAELFKRLRKYDKRFVIFKNRAKGSERMIYHPNINGRPASYPIKYHGGKTTVRVGHIQAIKRRFNLPDDLLK